MTTRQCVCASATMRFNPLVPSKFFLEFFLMKAHTEMHCGDTKGNPKFQVNTFIHNQDMEILNF